MTEAWPTVMVTGHRKLTREATFWVEQQLEQVLTKLRDEFATTTAVSGMALGVDQIWAELALVAGLQLHAFVPFPSQPERWPGEQHDHWQELLNAAAEVICVSKDDPESPREAARMLHQRNSAMIKVSQAVVAVAAPSKLTWGPGGRITGGTWSAIDKALRARKPIIWLNPDIQKRCRPRPETLRDLLFPT